MGYLYNSASDEGELVVIAAQDFAAPPVARVPLPVRVPYGFHGNWFSAEMVGRTRCG